MRKPFLFLLPLWAMLWACCTVAPAQTKGQDRVYKPSKKALANDPAAAVDTLPSAGNTKTVAQLHAAYEHLDKAVYQRPYYDRQLFYFMDTPDSRAYHEGAMADVCRRLLTSKGYADGSDYVASYSGGSTVLPIGFHTLWASLARYASDPRGTEPYLALIDARILLDAFSSRDLAFGTAPYTSELRDEDDVLFGRLPDTPLQLLSQAKAERTRLEAWLGNVTPPSVLRQAAAVLLEQGEQARDRHDALLGTTLLWRLDHVMADVSAHDDGACPDSVSLLQQRYTALSALRESWQAAARTDAYGVQAMPATVKKDAAFTNKVLAAARKKFPSLKVQRVVFFESDWLYTGQYGSTTGIPSRSQRVGLLYKKGSQWMLQAYELVQQQGKKGYTGPFLFQVLPEQREPRRVDYKGK